MNRLHHVLTGAAVFLLLLLSLLVWGTPVMLGGAVKFFLRTREQRRRLILVLARFGEKWAAMNSWAFDRLLDTEWDVAGDRELKREGKYLLIANHRSWIDIFVIYRIFNRRIPFIRFFLKRQLLWLPIAGFGCWALDFPFMRRYSPEYLARHPEKRGMDLSTTRRACRRYKRVPVAMLNFLEGTRFTAQKHQDQNSPYRHLLRPRAGGVAYVLATMGEHLNEMLDITIAYPEGRCDLWSFLSNRIPRIVVRIRQVPLPSDFLDPALAEGGEVRAHFNEWAQQLWEEKDRLLDGLLSSGEVRAAG